MAVFVGGCTWYDAPEMVLADDGVVLMEETDEGRVYAVTLEASNGNDVELPLRRVEYRASLRDAEGVVETFRYLRSAEVTLPAGRSMRVTIPVVHTAEAVGGLGEGAELAISGTITYQTPGQFAEVLFDTGVRVPSVGFRVDVPLGSGGVSGADR